MSHFWALKMSHVGGLPGAGWEWRSPPWAVIGQSGILASRHTGILAFLYDMGGAMFGTEERVLLRRYVKDGMKKAEIARRIGIGRRTVYRWIAAGELDRDADRATAYGPRPRRPSKLDPYKGIVRARLVEYPRMSAVRLFEEVRAAGYPGGYDQVKRYARRVRSNEPEEAVRRFETDPGVQGQVDFAEFRLPWGKRHALVVVLGYSRLIWLRFYERQTMPVVIRGLESSFSYFGGVPAELLFDQMKAVVTGDARHEGGELIENREFLRFSKHWGFRIRACQPYRAKTKGKVERPIRYIRDNFFYGRPFVSDDDLNARARQWMDQVANVRVHGTLKERPADRHETEKPFLTPLAPTPYRSIKAYAALPAKVRDTSAPRVVDVERRPLCEYAKIAEASHET